MQRQVTGATLVLAGLVLAGVQVFHASIRTSTTVGFTIAAVPFVLMALTVSFAGYWIGTNPTYSDHTGVVAAWAGGGAVAFAAISALMLTSLNVATETFPLAETAQYATIDNITAGALAGVLVGLYDARARTRRDELQRQRDRVESFANRAADLNSYGRALNESDTLEEVGALCVEAVAMLLDIRQAAVVELRREAATVVASTVVDVDDRQVAELATTAHAAAESTGSVHEVTLPDELRADVGAALAVTITESDGATVAIVALDRDGGSITEETRSLLELLVSHAATALSSTYQPSGSVSEDAVDIDLEPAADGE